MLLCNDSKVTVFDKNKTKNMSFNTIIEAEKEADFIVSAAKDKSKQMVEEASAKQKKDIEEAKSTGEAKMREDLLVFEGELNQTIEAERKKADEQIKVLEQNVVKQKTAALERIIGSFK